VVSNTETQTGAKPIGQVLDTHAELRELHALIREAGEPSILGGLLQRLESLLLHFDRRKGRNAPPSTEDEAAEHAQLLAALRDLQRRVSANGKPLARVRGELEAFLVQLERHHARESALLDDALVIPAGNAPSLGVSSAALVANLRRTAVEVVIPAEQAALLEMTENLHGVHEATRRLLREINHHYVGWPETLAELHRRATSDLAYYLAHDRAEQAIDIFTSLYARAVEQASPDVLRHTATRSLLAYLTKVATECGAAWRWVRPAMERALEQAQSLIDAQPDLAPAASPRVRRLLEALLELDTAAAETAQELGVELLTQTLRRVYRRWLALEDPSTWWREHAGGDAAPEPLHAISNAHLTACLESVEATPDVPLRERAATLLALPDNAQIQRSYVDVAVQLGDEPPDRAGQPDRIRWLIRLLALPELAEVHERALGEINRAFQALLRAEDHAGVVALVHETFAALRQSDLSRSPTALHLIEGIGGDVLANGDPDWVQPLLDELLAWDFPAPRFEGYTDDWQVRVDPAHLRAIRAYLALIETHPVRARPLIAALVTHLRLGGVFVVDTDLLQRDVSRLLNANIQPVYHPVKHLLKLFPVYFSDIGAEGELREVSSHIDEIGGRQDPLCHFLRKQCHVECNPRLMECIEAKGQFLASGEREALRTFVPPSLYEQLDVNREEWAEMHRVFSRLAEDTSVEALFILSSEEIEKKLAALTDTRNAEREKAALLFRLRALIGAKYEINHDDVLARLAAANCVKPREVESLRTALSDGEHEQALEILITALERLEAIILKPEKTEGFEDIYRKRHIAVGIPSVYGRYQEEKFDALGLSLRVESLVNALFERLIDEQDFELVTCSTLERVQSWLHLMLRGIRIDGCHGRGLANALAMLEECTDAGSASVDQYINIFQLLSRGVEQLIRIRFMDVYEPVLDAMLPHMLKRGALPGLLEDDPRETAFKVSEGILRDLIAESLALPQIDTLVGRVLRSMLQAREKLDTDKLNALMTYDGECACVPIDRSPSPLDGPIHLGNKGHLIKRMAREGMPVPPGFVLTTEVFRCRDAIRASQALRDDVALRIRIEMSRLESETGRRFGDRERPLLISVRSGSAISMPGILDTLLNVGLNEKLTEAFAVHSDSPWGAWDAYRRLLQFWGMGHGVERERFGALMREAKQRAGALKKSHLSAEAMRGLALRYRDLLVEAGTPIPDDPFAQLFACVELVLDSWNSEKARLYRRELRIAEEWGTAVIVQSMVYGNLHDRAGTGVVLTCNPQRKAPGVRLYGDFITQAQGDDVVSGLVETHPISEDQRRSEAGNSSISLEKDFPRIYEALERYAHKLIYDQEMFHQEIEFTFEGDNPADLYLLQTRDLVTVQGREALAFVPCDALEAALLATGIAAGGGALSGRCAHSDAEISALREQYPDDPIILVRPDTVPDDLPLMVRVAGMVTAIGGATSHAALAAQRLGRVCVVGCRQLEVNERRGRSTLAGQVIKTGEFISINGSDGSIYLGHHPTKMVRRDVGLIREEATG